MALVEYKCDVCKRTIQIPRNPEGLERISRCTITHGCRGKLYQKDLLEDHIRAEIPDEVEGLSNWIQRKVLHNHTQAVERDEWVIVHNMGTAPIVSVFGNRPIEGDLDNREELTPEDIIFNNENTLTVRFDRPWSGIAQLVGRQSDPNLLQPIQQENVTTEQPVQISSNGEITIATRINTIGEPAAISLNIQFDTATGTEPIVLYSADDQPSIDSPWLDFDKIVVRGKIYTVRSFTGLVSEITTGVINSGSTFRFVGVDENQDQTFRDIQKEEILILLASEPYELVDKQRDRFIDVTSVTPTQNRFSFVYNSGEFFAEPAIIQNTYPPIRSV